MINLIIIFLSFLFTVGATPYFINFLFKNNIVDKPNGEDRHIHTEPIPRLGGVIIFAVIISITLTFYHDISSILFFISGALVVFILGILDDLRSIKWNIKFLVQSVAVILLIISFNEYQYPIIKLVNITLPYGLNNLVLFVLILGILNSFNLMDGLDGLVTGYSLIVASMCFLLNMGSGMIFTGYLSAAVIGTTLGFLKFNANPARIFLGDSGSLTLGYLITSLVIIISGVVSVNPQDTTKSYSNTIDLTFIIIALALPIIDTLRVILVRFKRGNNLFLADANHLHHILLNKKIKHKTVVLLIHIFSVMFVLLAIYYAKFSKANALVIFTVLIILFFSIEHILTFLIKKKILITYSKVYNSIPDLIPKIYKIILLPIISLSLIILFAFLIFNEVNNSVYFYRYFILLLLPSLFYSTTKIKNDSYYPELLVLINIVLFFLITGLSGFFYTLHPAPLIDYINFNQLFIFILSILIIFFALFKERVANLSQQFLTGGDLIITVLISSIYIAVQFIDLPDSYKISDTLLRSFLVYLFYKILIVTLPKIHLPLYYFSFFITVVVILISIF